ncbi:MAG: hypothetical protein LBF44_02045 [Holosporaceae bacterium]|jgi:pimeloyl-[acyl-carrier protein] methyl ester esterase|nr:hypothetical protein [Holosporaceae bacterium]
MKYTYLLCPGFGFSNKYWRNLAPLLDGSVVFFDDNYKIDKKKRYVGIGHSLGFQKLNNSGIKFDFLIGLQGFLNFCGNEPNEKERRRRNIHRLIKMLTNDAYQTLKIFYDACQYPDPISENIVVDDLKADLLSMEQSYPHCGHLTLVIGSDADQIVPLSVINDNFIPVPKVIVKKIDGINHLLGFVRAEEVSKKIRDFIDERKNKIIF